MVAEVENTAKHAMLPPRLVRWNPLSSPYHSSTEEQSMSTQEGAAPQEHQETSY